MNRFALAISLAILIIPIFGASASTCTDPEGETGIIYFNRPFGVFQGCAPNGWQAFHAPNCPSGDACDPPDLFSFSDRTDVALSTLTLSNIIQITGLDREASIEITGEGTPEYRVCPADDCSTEKKPWSAANGTIENEDYLQLRLVSSDLEETTLRATVSINGTTAQWNVITELELLDSGDLDCTAGPFVLEREGEEVGRCDDASFVLLNALSGDTVSASGANSAIVLSGTADQADNHTGTAANEIITDGGGFLENWDGGGGYDLYDLSRMVDNGRRDYTTILNTAYSDVITLGLDEHEVQIASVLGTRIFLYYGSEYDVAVINRVRSMDSIIFSDVETYLLSNP